MIRLACWTLVSFLLAGCPDDAGVKNDAGAKNDTGAKNDAGVQIDTACRSEEPHSIPLGPEDNTFHVGPYLMHTTRTSVSLSWETVETGSTLVEYGPDASYGKKSGGTSGTMHQVTLTGLEPGTVYHYRCCTDDLCTGDLTFSTAPEPGRPFRFAVYGDSRSNPTAHKTVADSIANSKPIMVINTGDVVAGNDEGEKRGEYKEMHFDPARRLGHYLPIYVAIGNHEYKEKEAASFIEYMIFPEDPDVPYQEVSYSFTYGDAFFLVLDSTLDHFDVFFPVGTVKPPLWLWLQKQVTSEAARAARWRFAFFHYAPDSPCYDEYGLPMSMLRDPVIPLLRDNGFHAAFAGHEHDYEHHDYDGFVMMVTGGGGANLETKENCTRQVPELKKMESLHHHLTVDVGCDQAVIQAVDTDDKVFDRIVIPVRDGSGNL